MVSTEKKTKKEAARVSFSSSPFEKFVCFLAESRCRHIAYVFIVFFGYEMVRYITGGFIVKERERLLWDIYSAENKIRFLIELPNNVAEATPRKFTIKCFVSTPILPIPLILISRIELTFNWIIAITLHSSRLNCARLSLSHKRVCVTVLLRSKNPKIQKGR